MQKHLIRSFLLLLLLSACNKEPVYYLDEVRSIKINDKISVDNGITIHNDELNCIVYKNFLSYLTSCDRYLFVKQKDLDRTNSTDKVIISIRHDIDDKLNASVKFAYLENKYGIPATYFFLHTAKYYGETKVSSFRRNDNIIDYMLKLQNDFGHEVGLHNDLITLQLVYQLDSRKFLSNELNYLRSNNISVYGTAYHGSEYCYQYHYTNNYFWKEYKNGDELFYNFSEANVDGKLYQIEKGTLPEYGLEYESGKLNTDYMFTDSNFVNGKRWNMGMINFDTIPAGKKVILILHPEHWD